MAKIALETCVDNLIDFNFCYSSCIDRVELCSCLAVGGVTPSDGMMAMASNSPMPTVAMIRPRAGGFCYSLEEIKIMQHDIERARNAGIQGVVFGANCADGTLDTHNLSSLCVVAKGLEMVLHRSFDLTPDLNKALEDAIELGFTRILTSGGEKTLASSVEKLIELFDLANGRIEIMPGSGLTPKIADALLSARRFAAVHASCSSVLPMSNTKVEEFGFGSTSMRAFDPVKAQAIQAICRKYSP